MSRPLALSCRIWSTRELDGWAVSWSQQSGVRFPILGWSGIFDTKLSNFSLNNEMSQFFTFLILWGSALNSLPPCTLREASLKVLTLALYLVQRGGIFTSRPFVLDSHTRTPGLGTKPSIIFQMYMIRYLSNLRCWLFIFNVLSRSQ